MSAGAVTAFAPGRAHLLGPPHGGSHGLTLSFALAQGVAVRATTLPGPLVMVRARDLRETDAFDAWRPGADGATGWRRLVRAAADAVAATGRPVPAARLDIAGTVPRCGGLGSSAALVSAVALALLELGGAHEVDARGLAGALASADGGAPPYVPLLGREGHLLRVDPGAGAVEAVPMAVAGWRFAVVGTDERRVPASAEAPAAAPAGGEDERVEAALRLLRAGDLHGVGALMDASDAALGPGGPEVARAAERCRDCGAAGARRIGGGRVLALLAPGAAAPRGAMPVQPSAGARLR